MTSFAEDIAQECLQSGARRAKGAAAFSAHRALLKRAAGETLDTARDMAWLYYLLTKHRRGETPADKAQDEYRLFLVASLMAQDKDALAFYAKNAALPQAPKNFGATLDAVEKATDPAAWEERHQPKRDPKAAPRRVTPLERRLRLLLDARTEPSGGGELPFRLRQTVKLALDKDALIDWDALLWDLRAWDDPDKRRQKDWARAFYGYRGPQGEPGADPAGAEPGADEDDIDLDED